MRTAPQFRTHEPEGEKVIDTRKIASKKHYLRALLLSESIWEHGQMFFRSSVGKPSGCLAPSFFNFAEFCSCFGHVPLPSEYFAPLRHEFFPQPLSTPFPAGAEPRVLLCSGLVLASPRLPRHVVALCAMVCESLAP